MRMNFRKASMLMMMCGVCLGLSGCFATGMTQPDVANSAYATECNAGNPSGCMNMILAYQDHPCSGTTNCLAKRKMFAEKGCSLGDPWACKVVWDLYHRYDSPATRNSADGKPYSSMWLVDLAERACAIDQQQKKDWQIDSSRLAREVDYDTDPNHAFNPGIWCYRAGSAYANRSAEGEYPKETMKYHFTNVPADLSKAQPLLLRGCENDHSGSCGLLVDLYEKRQLAWNADTYEFLVRKNCEMLDCGKHLSYGRRCIKNDDIRACRFAAATYDPESGIKPDHGEYNLLMKHACSLGAKDTCRELHHRYRTGCFTEKYSGTSCGDYAAMTKRLCTLGDGASCRNDRELKEEICLNHAGGGRNYCDAATRAYDRDCENGDRSACMKQVKYQSIECDKYDACSRLEILKRNLRRRGVID